MITNPYKILGVPDGASEEECTKAYKRLAKKYHPDLNPNDKTAEEKMAQINAAYDQIKSGNATQPSGYSYSSYSDNGYNNYSRRSQQSSSTAPDYLKSAAQFIKSGQYQQAVNLLNNIEDRNARWYYLSSLANMSLGNRAIAEDHIRTAYAKDPNNTTYKQAYENITQGINPLEYNPFSSFFDFTNQSAGESRTGTRRTVYTTTGRRRTGCLGRLIRLIFIIFIIRLIFRFIFSAFYSIPQQKHKSYQQPTTSYSQQYNYPDNADTFGESNGNKQSS